MVDDYTYNINKINKKSTRYNCSSQKNCKCNASVIISNNSEDIQIVNYRNIHNHQPPNFYVTEKNVYILLKNIQKSIT